MFHQFYYMDRVHSLYILKCVNCELYPCNRIDGTYSYTVS